jgi:glycosyltransferase involved in cell wall biosynthesis
MKICLVTTFPPSRGGLSEYGFHIARELQHDPFLSLTILADTIPGSEPEIRDFFVIRPWTFNDLASPLKVLSEIRRLKPDVVWFNLIFTTFGHDPFVAFLGLMLPALSRMTGCYTHVTLHHLMDTVDLEDLGVRFPRVYRAAGAFATRMLLMSNSVSVLMPAYRKILQDKYKGDNVHIRSHGLLSGRPEYPNFAQRGNPVRRIVAFGKWGTYKRLEGILEAFRIVSQRVGNVKLIIAGGDHPRTEGYVASVAKSAAADPNIHFTGYVEEDRIADLFRTASIAAMPYTSSTGSSGVAHIACAYGVPIVSAGIVDFKQMADEEGLAIEFYEPGNTEDLANRLIHVLENPDVERAMALQNFSAALRMTMPRIVCDYLRHFDLARQTKNLRSDMRLRRAPQWLRSWPFLNRWIGGRGSWAYRPAVSYMRPNLDSVGLNGAVDGKDAEAGPTEFHQGLEPKAAWDSGDDRPELAEAKPAIGGTLNRPYRDGRLAKRDRSEGLNQFSDGLAEGD